MNWSVALFASIGWATCSLHAGTITGTARAQAKAGAGEAAAGGKYDSRKFKFAERIDYAEMRDFVVYIDGPLGTNAAPPDKPVQIVTTRKISQKGALFSPRVLQVAGNCNGRPPNRWSQPTPCSKIRSASGARICCSASATCLEPRYLAALQTAEPKTIQHFLEELLGGELDGELLQYKTADCQRQRNASA